MCPNSCLQYFETILKIAALCGGLVYVVFKFTNGFYVYNLSLFIKCERQLLDTDCNDLLSITAELSKGDVSSVDLHDIQARVSYEFNGETKQIELSFNGIRVMQYGKSNTNYGIVWSEDRVLRLSPGEKTQFSTMARVPSGVPCFVEVAVVGKRSYVGRLGGRWKATASVLPCEARITNPA